MGNQGHPVEPSVPGNYLVKVFPLIHKLDPEVLARWDGGKWQVIDGDCPVLDLAFVHACRPAPANALPDRFAISAYLSKTIGRTIAKEAARVAMHWISEERAKIEVPLVDLQLVMLALHAANAHCDRLIAELRDLRECGGNLGGSAPTNRKAKPEACSHEAKEYVGKSACNTYGYYLCYGCGNEIQVELPE